MRAKKTQETPKAIVVDAPVFRSEAEEAEWWDKHRELIGDLLLKHGRRGALPTRNVSLRLPVTDIERARRLAEKRGIGYQTLIKTLLHEALRKESKIA
jgi:predicted DNA binding CopG/RHH family protein